MKTNKTLKLFAVMGDSCEAFEVYFFDTIKDKAHFLRGFEAAAEGLGYGDFILTPHFSEVVSYIEDDKGKTLEYLMENDKVFRHYELRAKEGKES